MREIWEIHQEWMLTFCKMIKLMLIENGLNINARDYAYEMNALHLLFRHVYKDRVDGL